MNLNDYLPFYWTVIANRWTASSSRTYMLRFGIGVVEWRLLATLAAQDGATVLDAAKLTGMDVAAASRAMKALHGKALVTPVAGRFPGRSRPFRMNQAGQTLFEAVGVVAEQRLATLLRDLSSDEHAMLLRLLQRVHGRLPELNQG